MNKPPAFQFYVKDWRSSSTVRSMTREQRGDFIDMLAAAWDQDEPGTLPLPFELAAKICGMSIRSFRKFVETFPKLWQIDGGRLVNPRLRAQYEENQQRQKAQSDAGKRGNEKRWGKASGGDSGGDRSASASASASALKPTAAAAAELTPSCGNVEKQGPERAIARLAQRKSLTPVRKTQKELDERRRFLQRQAEELQRKGQSAG